MIELISLIAKSLVKQPDAVSVTMVQKGNVEVYELHVAPEDMGKVIGKQGRIAKAIRSVVKAAAIKENKYCLKGSIPMEEMTLRVPVAVKAKVTDDLKAKIVSDLETRLDMVNKDLEAIEFQAQRILADAAKVDATSLTAIRQQIDEEKNKRLAFKEEVTAKLKDAKELSLGTEIPQGTLEQTVTVKIGDNLDALMGAEILLEDGKIVAFRQ